MKLIPLTKGYFTKVDDEDFEKFAVFRWQATVLPNAIRPTRTLYVDGKKIKTIYLYREIVGARPGQYVDHINGDPLDNRKSNLRFCSTGQNLRNSKARGRKWKGVYRYSKKGKWFATICKDYKIYNLGFYDTEELAARAYDVKAKELHGEYARLNFPA